MEINQQQKDRLVTMEQCLQRYFQAQIRPVMDATKRDLQSHQTEEYRRVMDSPSSFIRFNNPNPGVTEMQIDTLVRTTGEWNSKTTEDYLEMCRARFQESPHIPQDLSALADLWRKEIIDMIGREAYDDKSKALGQDLANAYVSYRMEHQMVQLLIDERTPKSSVEYITMKGMSESLLGTLSYKIHESGLESYISEKSEERYAPTLMEAGMGKVLGFGSDVMMTMGFGSWAKVGGLAISEIGIEGLGVLYEHLAEGETPVSVEEYISKGVLGAQDNVLARIQKEAGMQQPDLNDRIREIDDGIMMGRLKLLSPELSEQLFRPVDYSLGFKTENAGMTPASVKIPYAPGYDPQAEEIKMEEKREIQEETLREKEGDQMVVIEEQTAPTQQQTNGWGSLLASTGFSGLGDIGRNLGYVVSMLPDVMVGLFTGKTKSLDLKNNLLPIASVLVGLFVRNPLLKMVLIGMGGLNLLNKAGHETIDDQKMKERTAPTRQFRQYEDQPLDARIKDPEIKGSSLFATIDGVPCTIQLPEMTAAAYQAGALPLNRLANAVLAKSDEMNRVARENYDHSEEMTEVRSRGLT